MKTLLFVFLLYSIDVPTGKGLYLSMDKVLLHVQDYYDDCREYPLYPDDLSALIESDKSCWKGPYVRKQDIIDSVNKQRYKIKEKDSLIVIISAGIDGEFNTNDDMTSMDNKNKQKTMIALYLDNERRKNIHWFVTIGSIFICFLTVIYSLRKKR